MIFAPNRIYRYLGDDEPQLDARACRTDRVYAFPLRLTRLASTFNYKLSGITMLTPTRYVVVTRREATLNTWYFHVFDINPTTLEVSEVSLASSPLTLGGVTVPNVSDTEHEVVALGPNRFAVVAFSSTGSIIAMQALLCSIDGAGTVTPKSTYETFDTGEFIFTSSAFQAVEQSSTGFLIAVISRSANAGIFSRIVTYHEDSNTLTHEDTPVKWANPGHPTDERFPQDLKDIAYNEATDSWVMYASNAVSFNYSDAVVVNMDAAGGGLTVGEELGGRPLGGSIGFGAAVHTICQDPESGRSFSFHQRGQQLNKQTDINSITGLVPARIHRSAQSKTTFSSNTMTMSAQELVNSSGDVRYILFRVYAGSGISTGDLYVEQYKASGSSIQMVSSEVVEPVAQLLNHKFPKLNLGPRHFIPYAYQAPKGGKLVTGTISMS